MPRKISTAIGTWRSGKPIELKFIFKTNLVENTKYFKKELMEIVYKHYHPKFNNAHTAIELELKALFEQKVKQSDTYKSLRGEGDKPLSGHFGFDDGGNKVDVIVNQWIEDIHVDTYLGKKSSEIGFGYKLYLINRTFADVLALDAAYQDVGTGKIPWLQWLLLEGKKTTIISEGDYAIHFESGKGRSSLALMVKRKKASRWSIPTQHAGTLRNNWITRLLKDIYPLVDGVVEKVLERYLQK